METGRVVAGAVPEIVSDMTAIVVDACYLSRIVEKRKPFSQQRAQRTQRKVKGIQ